MNGSSPRPALEQALRGAISKHAERGALDVADVGLAVGQLLLVVITEALTRAAYGGRALTASLAPHGQDQGLELGAGLAGRPVGAVLGAGLAGGVVRGVALGGQGPDRQSTSSWRPDLPPGPGSAHGPRSGVSRGWQEPMPRS